jgi:two-component system response regulator MprA
VARRLRGAGSKVPILMLTARDADKDVVRGLDNGADDYLTKPFSFEVLAARLRAMVRRASPTAPPHVWQVADLVVDTESREVRRAGRLVVLTRTEFLLLEHLIERPGRVISRADLIEAVWGADHDVEPNALDVFIFQLRSKLESHGARRLIQTVRGFGYAIRESVE